jgi:hypothetical protein
MGGIKYLQPDRLMIVMVLVQFLIIWDIIHLSMKSTIHKNMVSIMFRHMI